MKILYVARYSRPAPTRDAIIERGDASDWREHGAALLKLCVLESRRRLLDNQVTPQGVNNDAARTHATNSAPDRSQPTGALPVTLAGNLLFQLAKPAVLRREAARDAPEAVVPNAAPSVTPGRDRKDYDAWRDRELEREFLSYFAPGALRGHRVLDFGCGTGGMSLLAARLGAVSVDGVDLRTSEIAIARDRLAHVANQGDFPRAPIAFHVATNDARIDFSDQQFDCILCFDVLEHIMRCREILREWHRILSPGGRVLIAWQPALRAPLGASFERQAAATLGAPDLFSPGAGRGLRPDL